MFDLLQGTRVLEVSLLAPDACGQHLADLGAEVIKVEGPPHGDYVRRLGSLFIDGVSVLHLRWNRGKKSVWLDLKSSAGTEVFRKLVGTADVLLDGLRPGALERLGLGYDSLRTTHPALVYCSLSGLGTFGPYKRLATHGVFYDAFAGLAPPVYPEGGDSPRIPSDYVPIGLEAAALHAALAVTAALLRARRIGEGSFVEVAEADAAALWPSATVDGRLNDLSLRTGPMERSVRYSYYRASDGGLVVFQASEDKFWRNFCEAVGRSDLLERFPSRPVGDHASGNEELRAELAAIFSGRTQAQWTELFIAADVPGGPAYTDGGFIEDPHFVARKLTYRPDEDPGSPRLSGTPIKVAGRSFGASLAPRPGQHTREVLTEVLGMAAEDVASFADAVPA